MSGGRFDYKDFALKDEIFGYGDKCTNVFEDKEISQLVWDILDLIHEFDWYKSGDTDEKDYLKAKIEFKNKWLSNNQDERAKEIIDKTIEEAKQELYKTFGFET